MAATDEILRPHAEAQYADELAALGAADDRERPPNWQLSPWAVVTYLVGGELPDGTVITPKYVGRRRLVEIAVATLATDRALLLLGVPGHRQDLGERAPGRRDQRQLDAARAGHGRHDRGDAAVRLELCPPARRGAVRGCTRAEPDLPGDAARCDRPGRRTHADAVRRAGRTGHRTVREVDADPRAQLRSRGHPGLQRDRHRERPRPRRQRPVVGAAASLQHGRAPACPRRPTRRSRSCRSGSTNSAQHWRTPRDRPGRRGDPTCRHRVPRTPRRGHGRWRHQPQGAQRHAVDRRSDLGRHERAVARRPLRRRLTVGRRRRGRRGRRRGARPDPRSVWRGASTSKPWSPAATAGATSTTPVDPWAEGTCVDAMAVHLLGIRHHGPGSARSVVASARRAPTVDRARRVAGRDDAAAFAWIGDAGLEPPVALLGHVVDDPRRAAFAPLASFSPEWQAIRWANEHEVPVEAIDLPLANTLAGAADDGALVEGEAPVDPLGALVGGSRRAGRRTMVGRRDRAPWRGRPGVRRRRRGDGGGPVGHDSVGVRAQA